MEGELIDEDDRGVGIRVTDNDGAEHTVVLGFDGTVQGHSQDSYPDDPSEQTNYEAEMIGQARLFAKWYAYRNTEYDTLTPHRNPDRIAATLLTIHGMDDEAVERYFGTFYRQARSETDESVSRPIELEPNVPDDRPVLYKQDVYLAAGIDEVRGVHEEFAQQVGEVTEDVLETLADEGIASWLTDGLSETVRAEASERSVDLPQFEIDRVSDLYYTYYLADGSERTVGQEVADEDPDTRLQMTAPPADSLALFRVYIVRHLVCQIRDCYLGMGVDPPEAFRVLGMGLYQYTLRYRHYDFYPKYYDTGADIEGYVA